ncbi:hypothetical protein AVEN_225559-1 [Araneus ventricosus]|uniref:Uncharacterized protein n=1 Tax=Araneus ventricosus TaxID=182803 RepID=A0A4Y2IF79_ARAVE|nr:hypothetical protein AVEN_225559-1 [Araneus ventricosus]
MEMDIPSTAFWGECWLDLLGVSRTGGSHFACTCRKRIPRLTKCAWFKTLRLFYIRFPLLSSTPSTATCLVGSSSVAVKQHVRLGIISKAYSSAAMASWQTPAS